MVDILIRLCAMVCCLGITVSPVGAQDRDKTIVLKSGPVVRLVEIPDSPIRVIQVNEILADDGKLAQLKVVVRNVSNRPVLAAKLYLHMPDRTGLKPGRRVVRYFLGRPNVWVTAHRQSDEALLMPDHDATLAVLPSEDSLEKYVRTNPSWPTAFHMAVTVQRVAFGDGTGWPATEGSTP